MITNDQEVILYEEVKSLVHELLETAELSKYNANIDFSQGEVLRLLTLLSVKKQVEEAVTDTKGVKLIREDSPKAPSDAPSLTFRGVHYFIVKP